MDLPSDVLRNIELEAHDNGASDAALALCARRLIDKQCGVQFNPDNIPATLLKLLGSPAAVAPGKLYPSLVGQIIVELTNTDPTAVAQINASASAPVLIEMKAIPPRSGLAGYSGAGITIAGNLYFFSTNYISLVLLTPTTISPFKNDGGSLSPYFVLRYGGGGTLNA